MGPLLEIKIKVDSGEVTKILNNQFTSIFMKENLTNIRTHENLFRNKDGQLTSSDIL